MISTKMKFKFRFFSRLIALFVIVAFGVGWLSFYNDRIFETYRIPGGAVSMALFSIIYLALRRLYSAGKIATNKIGETVFSQILSFGLADALLFAEACLIRNRYVDVLPGLMVFALQTAGAVVWAVVTKRYFIRHNVPGSTLIICHGSSGVKEFKRKLLDRGRHIFKVGEMDAAGLPFAEIAAKIDENEIIILYELDSHERAELMEYALAQKKILYITPNVSDVLMQGFYNYHLVDTPLMKYNYDYEEASNYMGKRVMDLVLAALGLVVFSPFMLLTVAAIRLEDGGPVLFRQKRYTKNGKIFTILKFRSMVIDAEKDGVAIPCTPGDRRVTRVGRVIRRIRVDELPQLFNIIRGDMSIVGPRPERVEHMEEYSGRYSEFTYRLRVKAGLTGYAQIYGKYNTEPYDKLRLDLVYIENMSFLLDLKLVMLTLKTIFIPESTEGFSEERSRRMGQGSSRKQKTVPTAEADLLGEKVV